MRGRRNADEESRGEPSILTESELDVGRHGCHRTVELKEQLALVGGQERVEREYRMTRRL